MSGSFTPQDVLTAVVHSSTIQLSDAEELSMPHHAVPAPGSLPPPLVFASRGRVFAPAILLMSAVVLMAGCNPPPKGMPDLAPVSGVVTLGGNPLAKATVVFTSVADDKVSFGVTDDAGAYTLTYVGKHKGAAIGENSVIIKSQTDGPPAPNWKDPIPAKYNEKSELKADVKKGPNTIDFTLD
jgi:hypothetical protein